MDLIIVILIYIAACFLLMSYERKQAHRSKSKLRRNKECKDVEEKKKSRYCL